MTEQQYDLAKIRELLTDGFSVEILRRFCYDVYDFQPVYNELAENTGKAKIVDLLLDHANRTVKMEALLNWAEEKNPDRYNLYYPYKWDKTVPEQTDPDQEQLKQPDKTESESETQEFDAPIESDTGILYSVNEPRQWSVSTRELILGPRGCTMSVTVALAALIVAGGVFFQSGSLLSNPAAEESTETAHPAAFTSTHQALITYLTAAAVRFNITSSYRGKQELSSGASLLLKPDEVAVITAVLPPDETGFSDEFIYSYQSARQRVPELHSSPSTSYVAAGQAEPDILLVSIKHPETGYEIQRSLKVVVEDSD